MGRMPVPEPRRLEIPPLTAGMDFMAYSEERTNLFGNKVKPLFEKIAFNLGQIRTLTRLRDTLLPKLMNGEIQLKNKE